MSLNKISIDVVKNLEAIGLDSLGPKLEALGVRGLQDLALVDDADLVRWGLSTIQRRRFFGHVRTLLGDGNDSLALPPSALTCPQAQIGGKKKAGQRKTRREGNNSSGSTLGPARLDELLGRGSAEHQVPRLAERLLSTTGPLDVSELAVRLQRTAPALSQGYDETEWPQFVEACVRTFRRLQVEDGVLQGDKPIVSICSSILFSASEEVVADTTCWLKVLTCLATPKQVSILTAVCRASREVADGPEVWSKLLNRWYPKATLLNPDWIAQADLEKRLEEALENDYAFAALTKRLSVDTPYDIGDFMGVLPQQTTPKALMKFMSRHPNSFKQSPDGSKFCISRQPECADLKECKEWRTVNPFRTPPMPKSGGTGGDDTKKPAGERKAPMGRPKELMDQEKEEKKDENAPPSVAEQMPQVNICQRLDPKQAFRLYHTGLLSQRSDQSKRGKLEAWEYYTESNSKCVMAPSDLCDLADNRVVSIRSNDPAVVHELVAQTLEGLVYKVPFGFWNRRTRILFQALNASQLRVGREQRKKYERKLIEFMEWVKKERGFGLYQCDACGSRWKSGFSYEEIMQQCLLCGTFAKPYKIQDLETREDRERREQGLEPLPKEKGQQRGCNVRKSAPYIQYDAPTLEHNSGSAFGAKGKASGKRGPPDLGGGKGGDWRPMRPRYGDFGEESTSDAKGGTKGKPGGKFGSTPRPVAPPGGAAQRVAPPASASSAATPAPKATAAPAAPAHNPYSAPAAAATPARPAAPPTATPAGGSAGGTAAEATAQYTPGGGGFFARRRAAAGDAAPAAAAEAPAAASAASSSATPAQAETPAAPAEPATTYKSGGGGFFARRRAAAQEAGGDAVASDDTRTRSRSPRREAAAALAAPAAGAPAAATPAAALDLSMMGLSEEEARTMGLLPAAAPGKEAEAAKKADAPKKEEAPKKEALKVATAASSSSDVVASLGLSPEEAKAMGLVPAEEPAEKKPKTEAPAPAAGAPAAEAPVEAKEKYKAGAGGFFARRKAAAADGEEAPAVAKEKEAPKAETKDVVPMAVEKPMDAIPADKLMALKTLGLSLDDGVRMGIITAEMAVASKALEAAAAAGSERTRMRVETNEAAPADSGAAKRAKTLKGIDKKGPEVSLRDAAADEALVDTVVAAVPFAEGEITHQSSDVAYLLSDAVIWPLIRRVAAEMHALESGAGEGEEGPWAAAWAAAPRGEESAWAYAEERGYVLPKDPAATDDEWRRALLGEATSDLLSVRLVTGRAYFDLKAFAKPPGEEATAEDAMEPEDLDAAAVVSVTRSGGQGVARLGKRLVDKICDTASAGAASEASPAKRLADAHEAVLAKAKAAGDAQVTSLKGGWSLLQEMGVREVAKDLRLEYTSRRKILLRRLDVTIESLCAGKSAGGGAQGQRVVADCLAEMWASWRRGADLAPPLSEWSALMATPAVLRRSVTARVAGPGSNVKSSVKSMIMGAVPDRGGIPEGYKPHGGFGSQASAASAKPRTANAKPRARATITETTTVQEAPAPVAAASAPIIAAASSSGEGGAAAKPDEDVVAAKPVEDVPTGGARSTNKEGMHKLKVQQKKEEVEGRTYYEQLAAKRGDK